MNVLLRPVLRQLQANVRQAERQYGRAGRTASVQRNSRQPQDHGKTVEIEEDTMEGEDADILSTRTSELNESDLDGEIAELVRDREVTRQAKKKRKSDRGDERGDPKDDAWRYAFGKGNLDHDEGDDSDEEEGQWGDSAEARHRQKKDEAADDDDELESRVRDRNTRAMAGAEEEDGEEDLDDADAAAEELAALKELYGEDFEDDGRGFLGDDEDDADPTLAEDIELDDPANDDEYDATGGFDERDGMYFGKKSILDDEGGEFEDPTMAESARDGEEGAVSVDIDEAEDEELAAALRDPNLSELEKDRLREKKMIQKMEEKRLFGTDWSMGGETAAAKRPRDALLEVDDLEFEYGLKSTPVVTEAFTAALEDRIKKRIQEDLYDDVQRKAPLSTAGDLTTTKYDPALDAEKSKLSLMDLYEKEFLEKQRLAEEAAGGPDVPSAEPLTEIEKDELRAIHMWKRLAQHLDALSNFFYTPKPVQQDLEARVRAVENQAPAVALETVGNFATTRENALAPQDLYRGASRQFADVGTDELTPKERRTLRRSKKDEGQKKKERKEQRQQLAKKQPRKAEK